MPFRRPALRESSARQFCARGFRCRKQLPGRLSALVSGSDVSQCSLAHRHSDRRPAPTHLCLRTSLPHLLRRSGILLPCARTVIAEQPVCGPRLAAPLTASALPAAGPAASHLRRFRPPTPGTASAAPRDPPYRLRTPRRSIPTAPARPSARRRAGRRDRPRRLTDSGGRQRPHLRLMGHAIQAVPHRRAPRSTWPLLGALEQSATTPLPARGRGRGTGWDLIRPRLQPTTSRGGSDPHRTRS